MSYELGSGEVEAKFAAKLLFFEALQPSFHDQDEEVQTESLSWKSAHSMLDASYSPSLM
ncbi:MAG: hypothetical protein RIC14_09970 [Filomicrobium sp.]